MGREVSRRIRFSEEVMECLYRMGGCTTEQVARWLSLTVEEIERRDTRSRTRRSMTRPEERSARVPITPSYRIASKVLSEMRRAGEVEEIRLRRAYDESDEVGRLESFYRLARARSGEAILEAGLVAGVESEDAKPGYARIWSGGAIQHTAQRTDLLLVFAEAGRTTAHNECGFFVEPESLWSESHKDYPLVGACIEKSDAAGRRKYSSGKQKRSGYTGRTYERIVPDGQFEVLVPPVRPEPPSLPPETDAPPPLPEHRTGAGPNVVDQPRGVEYA